jgi:hypothetical protein
MKATVTGATLLVLYCLLLTVLALATKPTSQTPLCLRLKCEALAEH